MSDIVPTLLSNIESEFNRSISKNLKIKELKMLLETNQATYVQANEYAIEIGESLAKAFKTHITSELLPDGRMYYNIGERILTPTLGRNYDLVTEFTKQVQVELNRQVGIGLNASTPTLNPDKIRGLIQRLADELDFKDVEWILQEPIINFTHQAVNDVLEDNVQFQVKTGLSPKIKRTLVGGACDWCVRLAGTYSYPNNVPEDLYRRHERCRCTVEYIPDNIKKQNVWTKAWD